MLSRWVFGEGAARRAGSRPRRGVSVHSVREAFSVPPLLADNYRCLRCELTEKTDCQFVGPAADLGLHGLQCSAKYKLAVAAELAELAAFKAAEVAQLEAQGKLEKELTDNDDEEEAPHARKSTSTPVEPDANSGPPSPEERKSSKRSSLDIESDSNSDSDSKSDSPSAERRVKARVA